MKRIFFAVTIAASLSTAAAAADMPMKAAAPAAPAYNWTGFYLGVEGGGGWGRTEQISPGPVSSGKFDVSGGIAGGTIGYNWQNGLYVFGIEGDYSWANVNGSTTAVCGVSCSSELRSLGTVRARLGYAAGQFLPYVTGGYAFGDLRRGFGGTSDSKTADGWTAGAGIETILAPHWTVKAEYLYVDFGKNNVPIAGFPTTVDFQTHIVRAGLNYRF